MTTMMNCDTCSKSIKVTGVRLNRPHHFCCNACYGIWRSTQTGLNHPANKLQLAQCFHCGQDMWKAPWEIKKHEHTFCTNECYRSWLASKRSSELRKCHICKTEKLFDTNKLKRNEFFFCSHACRGVWISQTRQGTNHPHYKGPVTFTCTHCGKDFERKRNHIKRNNQKQFCTEQCMFDYMTAICGENHPWWKGGRYPRFGSNWNSQKRKARERDRYTCQDCHNVETPGHRRFHVHHIKPRAEGGTNDLNNLILLCGSCHIKREHQYARLHGTHLRSLAST